MLISDFTDRLPVCLVTSAAGTRKKAPDSDLFPQSASPHGLPPCISRRNAPSRIPAPWASCALLTLRTCHGLSLRLPHHVRRQRYPERTRILAPHFHSEGGIQMVTTELKRIPRTCPPDGAVIKYGIELNHADDSGSDRPIGQLRGTPVRIIVPIADRSLTTSNPARHSEAHQRSPYRVNCARCLVTAGTFWRHANRGPPGTDCREARGDRAERTAGRKHSACRGSEEKRNKEKGQGDRTANLTPPIPTAGASIEAPATTAYQKDN